jgi:cell wall-associated NlpC family hydrolase
MKPELIVTSEERIHLSNTPLVKKALYAQFDEWKSVRYRLGGLTKKGIDCSGFVYVTYRNQLGITLPRTTELQSTVGRKVSQQNLHAGDLVFFKTGFFTRHVGIYLENRKFLHASTSQGVMISSLDNAYWSEKYWQSIRVKI